MTFGDALHVETSGEMYRVRAHILIGPLMKFHHLRKYTGKMFLLIVPDKTSTEEDNRFDICGLLTEDPHNQQPDSLSDLNESVSVAAN